MGELIIRRNRTFAPPQYQSASKTGKTASTGQSQPVTQAAIGTKVSETLQKMTSQTNQMESDIRAGRQTVQKGQGMLDQLQDSLNRLAELARKAAEGEDVDQDALQGELEQLRGEIDRIISSAAADGTPLFLNNGSSIRDMGQLLVWLMKKAESGVSPDQAIQELTNGAIESIQQLQELLAGGMDTALQETLIDLLMTSGGAALLKLLMGMEGGNIDLLLSLLANLQTTDTQPSPEAVPESLQPEQQLQPAPPSTLELGPVRVSGADLSGVSFDKESGELTISGGTDVTVQGTGQDLQTIRLTGSGTVTLRNAAAGELVVESAKAQVTAEGRNQLGGIQLEKGTALTLAGEGRLELGTVRGDTSNTLYLAGGTVIVHGEKEESPGAITIPVVLEGTAVLSARAVSVTNAAGQRQEPFDLIWKTLLPGWDGLTSLTVDGKRGKLALLQSDPARLWLARGDQGFPAHSLVLQNQEKSGRIQTRYAYLQWNKQRERFEAVSMYPNPFVVTGGEAEQDWIYEEETQTLYILSSQVTAVSGGTGVDANQLPFSGRIALANGIGAIELTLEGVVCQVPSGRAFDLGEENQVTLILPGGASNLFASGAGCAGITLGDGTLLFVDCVQPQEEDEEPAGTLTAAGGLGCAGIGRDGVAGWDPADPVVIRGADGEEDHNFLGPVTISGGTVLPVEVEEDSQTGGIALQAGEETVILPQFTLSVRALELNGMSLSTREYARDAEAVLEADRRRVAQLQEVYSVLYDWLNQGARGLPEMQFTSAQALVRSAGQADTLLEDMRRSILLQPSQAMRTHNRRGSKGAQALLQ